MSKVKRDGSEARTEVKLLSFVTTITIIHEAESYMIAKQDAERMQRNIVVDLAQSHVAGEIGLVKHVSLYRIDAKV